MPYARTRTARAAVEGRALARLPADVLRSLLAASQRVGRGFRHRARWLADFGNADLSGAPPAAFDGWRWQAVVWSLADPPELEQAFRTALTWSPLWNPHDRMDDPSPVVLQLQRDLRTYVDGLL